MLIAFVADRRINLWCSIDYNDRDHKSFVHDWFAGFSGVIHADADPFFETLAATEGVTMAYCHAHARRRFEKITQTTQREGLAHHAMRVYQQLYNIERQAKRAKLTTDERYQLRLKHSIPLLEAFKDWLDTHYPLVSPQAPIGKAIAYCLKHWDGLNTFLTDGRIEVDNNLTEQQIKPFVVARKNFLFAGSQAGAKALCLHFSLVRTAIANGLDPYRYYVTLLSQIPHCQCVEDYEALLPWNMKLEQAATAAA